MNCTHCEENPADVDHPDPREVTSKVCHACYPGLAQVQAEREQAERIRLRELHEDGAVDAFMDRMKERRLERP